MTAPSIGQVVHYRLSAGDVAAIDHDSPRRTSAGVGVLRNPVREDDVYPAQVTAVFGPNGTANLVVQLDGTAQYWATSRQPGDGPGQYRLPIPGKPALGDVLLYRGKQGFLAPRSAIVVGTVDSIDPRGIESGAVPALTSDEHVHLWVFGPGSAGFAEFDVPRGQPSTPGADATVGEIPPGSWTWPAA